MVAYYYFAVSLFVITKCRVLFLCLLTKYHGYYQLQVYTPLFLVHNHNLVMRGPFY